MLRDLGRASYDGAYAIQEEANRRVQAERAGAAPGAPLGEVLLVEHDPVVTVTKRPGAAEHVLLPEDELARRGVEVRRTDRGGDVTYHGPGQLVAYPILDLKRLGLGVHDYVRTLEGAIIDCLAGFGVNATRDPSATGVWAEHDGRLAKVAAIGVRVRRWVTMHGLAINVRPDLAHFALIVPCGLHGRPVTSLHEILGDDCPAVDAVKSSLVDALDARLSRSRAPDAQGDSPPSSAGASSAADSPSGDA